MFKNLLYKRKTMILNIIGGLSPCPFEVLLGNLFCWPTFCFAKDPDFDCYYPAVVDDAQKPITALFSGPLPVLQKIQITICIFLIFLQLGIWIWVRFYHFDAGTWYLDRGSKEKAIFLPFWLFLWPSTANNRCTGFPCSNIQGSSHQLRECLTAVWQLPEFFIAITAVCYFLIEM